MKKTFAVVLIFAISLTATLGDEAAELRNLPTGVQRTIKEAKGKGEVKKVKSRRIDGRTIYEVEYKERGDDRTMLIAADGSVIDDDRESGGNTKGKGKAKGKAKGHYKHDRDEASDDSPAPAQVPSRTGTQVSIPSTPAPAQVPVPAQSPVPAPAPTVHKAPASATVPAPRSASEVRTELGQRINRINKLDNDAQTARAGLVLISKETGVPLATLQAQHKAYPVGTGGMLVCNEIAKTTHKNASVYLKQRLQNRDWTQIATENKFDLASVLPKLERIEQGMLAARKQARR